MEKNSIIRPKRWQFIVFLSLPLIWYTFIVIYPVFTALIYSFYNWGGGPNKSFIGLNNYKYLLSDTVFWQAFKNNLLIVLITTIGQIGLAFIFSNILASKLVRLTRFHRTVTFFPYIISAVVVGYVWQIIFDYNSGLINSLLRLIGLDNLTSAWLDNPSTIIFVACIPIIWKYIGYYAIILMAGITAIDPGVFEMAEIDGASAIQKALKITFPLIKPTILVAVTLCISGNMKIFDHIYTLTNGGPGNSSMVMALYAYKTTFIKAKFGYASALSIAIMILSLGVVMLSRIIINRPWKKGE